MYYINIATRSFTCPISRDRVKRGDAYMEDEDGNRFSLSQLPKRKLVPLKTYLNGSEIAVKSH